MRLVGSSLIAAIAFSAISTTSAFAGGAIENTTCSAIPSGGQTHQYSQGTLSIAFAAGDTVSWTNLTASGLVTGVNGGTPTTNVTSPGSYTAGASDTSFQLALVGFPGDLVDVSCSLAAGGGTIGESQTGATLNGISNNTGSRFGAGGNQATKNSIFLSTQNLPGNGLNKPEWNAWLNAESRVYTGGLNGSSYDVVVGVDKMIGADALVGVLAGYGRIGLTEGAATTSALSPQVGVYFGSRMQGGLIVDGFIAAARPQVFTAGTSFNSFRRSAGLTLTGRIDAAGQDVRPFINAIGFTESQPAFTGTGGPVLANNITSITVSAGALINFSTPIGGTQLRPYLSGAIDYRKRSSTLGVTDMFFAPRIGFGVSGPTSIGNISISIDVGKSRSDTVDIGAVFNYELNF